MFLNISGRGVVNGVICWCIYKNIWIVWFSIFYDFKWRLRDYESMLIVFFIMI